MALSPRRLVLSAVAGVLGGLFGLWALYHGWFFPGRPLLEKLPLAPGDAVLAVDHEWSNADPVSKRVGSFYMEDPEVLKRMKEEWVTGGPAPYFLCGYNYTLYLLSAGKVRESFDVNLERGCNTVVASDGSARWFELSLIEDFEGSYAKPRFVERRYGDLTRAREALAALPTEPGFLMVFEPEWTRYDGELRFEHDCGEASAAANSEEDCLAEVAARVRERYPGADAPLEQGMMSFSGGRLERIGVKMRCADAFRKKFDLFPVGKDDWRVYEPKLKAAFKS